MTDTKTPKPGEWWVSDSGLVAHVVGLTLDGEPAWQQKNSRQIWLDEIGFFLACFHYEPRCTGFDWVEPEPEPEQAEWSDMAAIQNLDLRRSEMASSGRISSAENQAIIQVIDIAKRAIQPVETWPKYYRGDNWCSMDAYVRFDDEYHEAIWVAADGTERVFHGERFHTIPERIEENSWREVTEAEALARVTVHPDDIPLNPVPGKVVATGTLKLTPVESPDDWVEITNRDHKLRAGIDEFRNSHEWAYVRDSHGKTARQAGFLNVRCRRKDLPVLVTCTCPTLDGVPVTGSSCPIHGLTSCELTTAAKRVPVRLWINGDDGVVFQSEVHVNAGDQEIKHDADGFYVEGGER